MALKTKFKVRGFEGIYQSLKSLPEEIAAKAVRRAQFESAALIKDEAKRRAPAREGRIKEFVDRQAFRDKSSGKIFVRVGIRKVSKKQLKRMKLTADAYYATFVEWGTRFQRAQHFMRDAFVSTRDRWVAVYEEDLRKQVDSVLKSHNKGRK